MTFPEFDAEHERRLIRPPEPRDAPLERPARPSGGGGEPPGRGGEPPDDDGDPRAPRAVLDRLLGREPGTPLEQAGPGARAVAEAIGGREEATPALAISYWWTVVRSPQFQRAMYAASVHRSTHQIMVQHAGGTRFDLLVVATGVSGAPRRLPVQLSGADLTMAFERAVRGNAGLVRKFRRLYPRVQRAELAASIREVARAVDFGVVIAAGLPTEPTSFDVPNPARTVIGQREGVRSVMTVGVVFERDGAWWATSALHGAPEDTDDVYVDDRPAKIVKRSVAGDICLMRVEGDLSAPGRERLEVEHRMVPRLAAAHFARPHEGRIHTQVTECDIGFADDSGLLPAKVYTPDTTQRGDSGTALVADTYNGDKLIAFSHGRLPIQHMTALSAWVSAHQALRTLGVHP